MYQKNWNRIKNNPRRFDFLVVYEYAIFGLSSGSFESDSKCKTYVMLTSSPLRDFQMLVESNYAIKWFWFSLWLDQKTFQSNAKCHFINQFNSKINIRNQDPSWPETRVLPLDVSPLLWREFSFPHELVGSEYFDVFVMHLPTDIWEWLLSAQKWLSFKFAHWQSLY